MMPPNQVDSIFKLFGDNPQPAEYISEGGCGNVEKRLPRLLKLLNDLVTGGRLTEDAWKSIDRELEYGLARSASGRLNPIDSHPWLGSRDIRPRDGAGRLIGGMKRRSQGVR